MPNYNTSRTPLRRISHSSLAALSASRNRDDEDDGSPLQHLAGVFAELSEAIQDMVVNIEALDAVNTDLTRFNHGFAGFLYGLRMNAYTGEFLNAPEKMNFERADMRAAKARVQEKLDSERAEAAATVAQEQQQRDIGLGYPSKSDVTFVTQRNDGDETIIRDGGSRATRGRGGSAAARGRALSVASGKTAAQKKKDALIKFAQPIVMTLPIEFREKQPQRGDAEAVIGALRDNTEGMRCEQKALQSEFTLKMRTVPELVKLFPLVPQHRINDVLLSLVRAKQALRFTNKGLMYRLDPSKHQLA